MILQHFRVDIARSLDGLVLKFGQKYVSKEFGLVETKLKQGVGLVRIQSVQISALTMDLGELTSSP